MSATTTNNLPDRIQSALVESTLRRSSGCCCFSCFDPDSDAAPGNPTPTLSGDKSRCVILAVDTKARKVTTHFDPKHFQESVVGKGKAYYELRYADELVLTTVDDTGAIQTGEAVWSPFNHEWTREQWREERLKEQSRRNYHSARIHDSIRDCEISEEVRSIVMAKLSKNRLKCRCYTCTNGEGLPKKISDLEKFFVAVSKENGTVQGIYDYYHFNDHVAGNIWDHPELWQTDRVILTEVYGGLVGTPSQATEAEFDPRWSNEQWARLRSGPTITEVTSNKPSGQTLPRKFDAVPFNSSTKGANNPLPSSASRIQIGTASVLRLITLDDQPYALMPISKKQPTNQSILQRRNVRDQETRTERAYSPPGTLGRVVRSTVDIGVQTAEIDKLNFLPNENDARSKEQLKVLSRRHAEQDRNQTQFPFSALNASDEAANDDLSMIGSWPEASGVLSMSESSDDVTESWSVIGSDDGRPELPLRSTK
ncbi:hypothetical protein CI109_107072 [Kwoniella shandongensis]|uniref:Uncharacterized protein n=1 Tax=Kwoniella shandongensis TaxID=1734106 RepID=A0A5M6BSS3_9TREE|nr:uncharacterized protein CI109_006480 [Kwoniella shandongensis]KAA5525211.1 hypothetical protein CI109_006480 [Kwoniella shandongensis]